MERLFYAPDIALDPVLPEEESQHCVKVLRLSKGDPIMLADGKGFFYAATIENAHPKHCRVTVTHRQPQKPLHDYTVHIAVAPTKNMDRMEWFVEKATEIGIDAITFLRCRHSERKDIKLQRLQKTVISAMKQSNKSTLPLINEIVDFENFISYGGFDVKMIAHCAISAESHRQPMKDCYPLGHNALILIGPEGDFSQDEITAALTAGFIPITLGESPLRTETAALVACHTIHLLNQ